MLFVSGRKARNAKSVRPKHSEVRPKSLLEVVVEMVITLMVNKHVVEGGAYNSPSKRSELEYSCESDKCKECIEV